MPIYEYQCADCNCEFEHISFSSRKDTPQCPSCCKTNVKRLISAGAIRPQGVPRGKGGFKPAKCHTSGG
jgi:putative FmdB family regulatory protein